MGLALLSTLLYHSVAVSAWKEIRRGGEVSNRWSLRVNPSSGNLHPTETYLAVRGGADLADGLYHYRVDRHALELRREGEAVRAALSAAGRDAPEGVDLVCIFSTIVWREAWKYRMRAYRYCLLDAGHAGSALVLAARALGLAGTMLGHFADGELAEVLASREGEELPLLLVPMGAPQAVASLGVPGARAPRGPASRLGAPRGRPNRLSKKTIRYEPIEEVHAATSLDSPMGPLPAPPAAADLARRIATEENVTPLPPPRSLDEPLGLLVRRRRSSLDHDPSARLSAANASAVLSAATYAQPCDWGFSLVRLYSWIHAVDGVLPGRYLVLPGARLALLAAGDQREIARHLSLEQDLAGDGVMAFSLVANFAGAGAAFGLRGYRLAHFEAGARGHFLYLSAHAAGIGGTGMGAYYDDETAESLGLDTGQSQPVYHFAAGRPVPDPRLLDVADPLGLFPPDERGEI
ncbi:MAG: SagB family peptide dehydrogenase [Planctomycetes bacterium]|nr:SagB family peptide dehydrogenase [Planctomycetota bacterium]